MGLETELKFRMQCGRPLGSKVTFVPECQQNPFKCSISEQRLLDTFILIFQCVINVILEVLRYSCLKTLNELK